MPSAIVIRPAERRDVKAIGRLGAQLMRTHYAYDRDRFLTPPENADEGYAWFLGTQIHDPEAVVLVAERDGEILGYVLGKIEPTSWMELRGPAGFIHDVAVAEGARRQGVASQLMEAAIARLEERGAPRIMLWTAEQNEGAHALFERLGFRRTMIEMTRARRTPPPPAKP